MRADGCAAIRGQDNGYERSIVGKQFALLQMFHVELATLVSLAAAILKRMLLPWSTPEPQERLEIH
jgi:hypothetical protein